MVLSSAPGRNATFLVLIMEALNGLRFHTFAACADLK
jgi:hypothetical protein